MANILSNGMPRPVLRKLREPLLLFGLFGVVLDGRAGPFVGPPRQRTAEMRGENRVRDLVRQHRIEDPLLRSLHGHPPAKNLHPAR